MAPNSEQLAEYLSPDPHEEELVERGKKKRRASKEKETKHGIPRKLHLCDQH